MDSNKIVTEMLITMQKDVSDMKENVVEIKTLLAAQTAKVESTEKRLKSLEKDVWIAKGSIAFIALAGTIASIWRAIER